MAERTGWVSIAALALVSCGGHGNMCAVPPGAAEPATVHIVHEHDFPEKSYEMTDVTYKLGDCVLLRTTDASVLGRKTVDLGSHTVLPGTTLVTLTTMFQSAFAADMHHYRWGGRVPFQIEIEPGSKVELRVRFHERWADDPRQRMKLDLQVNGRMLLHDY